MLNFILGPSGSGKSYQMLAELRARAERGERSILIVPEQFTSSTEGQLYRTLGDSLSAYVKATPSPRWRRPCCAVTAGRRCPP